MREGGRAVKRWPQAASSISSLQSTTTTYSTISTHILQYCAWSPFHYHHALPSATFSLITQLVQRPVHYDQFTMAKGQLNKVLKLCKCIIIYMYIHCNMLCC